MSGPRTLNGKIVLQVYMLDNSYKTVLIEPTACVQVRPQAARARCCRALPPCQPPGALPLGGSGG